MYEKLLEVMDMCTTLTGVVFSQVNACAPTHEILHKENVHCFAYALYFSKAVLKNGRSMYEISLEKEIKNDTDAGKGGANI